MGGKHKDTIQVYKEVRPLPEAPDTDVLLLHDMEADTFYERKTCCAGDVHAAQPKPLLLGSSFKHNPAGKQKLLKSRDSKYRDRDIDFLPLPKPPPLV